MRKHRGENSGEHGPETAGEGTDDDESVVGSGAEGMEEVRHRMALLCPRATHPITSILFLGRHATKSCTLGLIISLSLMCSGKGHMRFNAYMTKHEIRAV